MITQHSMGWPEQIHTERGFCDINHKEGQPEFDTEAEFQDHLNTYHGNSLSRSRFMGRLRRNRRRVVGYEYFACPLCNSDVRDIEKDGIEKPYERLWKHIAGHLKYLSFLSLSYLEEGLEGRESIADFSESVSDRDGASLSARSISDHSDSSEHRYCDRESLRLDRSD